jgi:hypothetical protein
MTVPSRDTDRPAIEAGLNDYWRDRALSAPVAAELRRYLDEQAAYLDAVMRDRGNAS